MTWCSSIFAGEIKNSLCEATNNQTRIEQNSSIPDPGSAAVQTRNQSPLPRITLTRTTPDVFALFHTYIHSGSLPTSPSPQDGNERPSYKEVFSLWIFADQHDIPLFQNYLIDLLLQSLLQSNTLPSPPEVENVFEQSFPGTSVLRQFLCALAIETWLSLQRIPPHDKVESVLSITSSLEDVLHGRPLVSSPLLSSANRQQPVWKQSSALVARAFAKTNLCDPPHDFLVCDGTGGRVPRVTSGMWLSEGFLRRARGCGWHVHGEGVRCSR
jgi:hypothetical protein